MGKRSNYVMVAEDDPQWMRFWAAGLEQVSKKDARKAWAKLNPDPALVDKIIFALSWQVPLWRRLGYGMPYPATYLNKERWTDEMPVQIQRQMSDAAASVFDTLGVKL